MLIFSKYFMYLTLQKYKKIFKTHYFTKNKFLKRIILL